MILDEPDQLWTWDIKTLWRYFEQLMEQTPQYHTEYNKVKQGYTLAIPIWYLIEEWYSIYPISGRVKVQGMDKMDLNDFMEEKHKRERVMRSIILNEMNRDPSTGRQDQKGLNITTL